jgi:predicted RNA methylase
MSATSEWLDFYKHRDPDRYYNYAIKRYSPFICAIAKATWGGAIVLEVGSGMGTITRVLKNYSTGTEHFLCTDVNPEMVALTRKNVPRDVHCYQHDMREPARYVDIIHGHGVLEHMGDADIRCSIEAHRQSGASYAFHYVPSDRYDEPSFGDERLLSAHEWQQLAAPSQIIPFNNDFDLCMIWRFRQ